MKKIGLIFGSFNPIHKGHLFIGQTVLNRKLVDSVRYVVAKQNPFKDEYSVCFDDRMLMTTLAMAYSRYLGYDMMSDAIESIANTTRTFDTLEAIKKAYGEDNEYVIICGDDMYEQIPQWYKGEEILKQYKFVVFSREFNYTINYNENIIEYITIRGNEIYSSTNVRKCIKEESDMLSTLLPESVEKYIKNRGFYV